MQKPFDLKGLAKKWPSAIVARSEVSRFSGGILNPRTLANLDSQGRGPGKRFYIGRKIAYGVEELVSWMEKRISEPKNITVALD